MDKLLLIIANPTLRQLYHELLFSKQTEIMAVETITHALMVLTFDRFSAIILYSEADSRETKLFLKLRKKQKRWGKTKLILLTPDAANYRLELQPRDLIINPLYVSIGDSIQKIKQILP